MADIEFYQECTWLKKIVATEDAWYCATRTAKPPRVLSSRGDILDGWKLAESFGPIRVWMRQENNFDKVSHELTK